MSESSDNQPSEIETAPRTSRPRAWRLGLLLLIAAGLILATIVLRQRAPALTGGELHPAVGSRLPPLTLEPLTGETPLSAGDLSGKVTLLNFWGPWCMYCRIEFPHLVALERELRGDPGFQFVSVSCPAGSSASDLTELRRETAEFLSHAEAGFEAYADSREIARMELARTAKLADFVYPTTVVLDGAGTIRGLWQGYADGDEQRVRDLVRKLLAEPVAERRAE